MGKSKLKPMFFCDNCGYEVGSDVKACPYCGRFFASVRCPACDYSGPDKMFQNGCPLCGYSAPPAAKPQKTKPKKEKLRRPPAEPLPPWALILAIIGLFAIILILSWYITT